jgi:hypothetical protein
MDFTKIQFYEFDCGSEWMRAPCLDTCESNEDLAKSLWRQGE